MTRSFNNPDQPEIAYRVGVYRSFLAAMAKRAGATPPLDRLNTGAAGDFTNALMGAWARVCDVLTFYQERIANEGFLQTAREPFSVLRLAGLLGVERWPPLAAETHVAVQLFDAKSASPGAAQTRPTTQLFEMRGRPTSVIVEDGGGLTVQDTPPQGRLPVVFESAETIELRAVWNAIGLAPDTATRPPMLRAGAAALRLAGVSTGVRAGSALLLDLEIEGAPLRRLVVVDRIVVDRTEDCTLVTWWPGPPTSGDAIVRGVTLFRRSAGLFGRNADAWADLSDAKRIDAGGVCAGGLLALEAALPQTTYEDPPDWRAAAGDLPAEADIRALAATPAGTLLAGTAIGLYRSTDGGQTWVRASLVPPRADVHSIYCAADGLIYAGCAQGLVFASSDDGVTWAKLTQLVATPKRPGLIRRILQWLRLATAATGTDSAWPLAGVVRAVTATTPNEICIGTDQGVFVMTANSPTWWPLNENLPGHNVKSGAADVSVRALLWDGEELIAATSRGLFTRPKRSRAWRHEKHVPAGSSLILADDVVYAGAAGGLYERRRRHKAWRHAELGGLSVLALAVSDGHLVASTEAGLYWRGADRGPFGGPADGGGWRSCNVQRLDTFSTDRLFTDALTQLKLPGTLCAMFARWGTPLAVGTTVASWSGPGADATAKRWRLIEPSDGGLQIPGGAFQITDGGRLQISQRLACPAPAGVLLAYDGRLLAATPFGPVLSQEWPDFHITDGKVFLDRALTGVEGGVMALAPADAAVVEAPLIYPVDSCMTVMRAAFGKRASVTCVSTTPDGALELVDLRRAVAYLSSTPLTVSAPAVPRQPALSGRTLALAGALDGLGANRTLMISGPRPAAAIAAMGGVFVLGAEGAPARGLAQETVRALAGFDGLVFAATGSGVFSGAGDGTWTEAGAGLPEGAAVLCLATSTGALYAGLDGGGVFRRAAGASGWTALAPAPVSGAQISGLAATADGIVCAMMADHRVFRYDPTTPIAPGWSRLPLDQAVTSLVALANGRLMAGTASGGVVPVDEAAAWQPISDAAVSALIELPDGGLAAGFANGEVHRAAVGADVSWRLLGIPSGEVPITALLGASDGTLYAGSSGGGAFANTGGGRWTPALISVSNDVRALTALPQGGGVLAGCAAAVTLSSRPPAGLERRLIGVAPAVAADALDQQVVPPEVTQALAGVTLKAPVVQVLAPGLRWLVRDGDTAWLLDLPPHLPDAVRLFAADLLEVVAPPPGAGVEAWTLVLAATTGVLHAQPGEITLQPARSDQSPVGEIGFISAIVRRSAERLTLTLKTDLRHAYDAGRVRVCANLVRVTQGETVSHEVLGSGDHAQPGQRFALQRTPLTYDAASIGTRSTLSVQVDSRASRALRFGGAPMGNVGGEPWTFTPSFALNGPTDRVYMLETTDDGRTVVCFGDGARGSRLPTGEENIVATYRAGAGTNGNVAAGTLVAPRKRPAGVRSVTNPVAAHGGRDIESVPGLRSRTPRQQFDARIVTLDDYAAFARCFRGVGAVKVQLVPGVAGTPTVWIWASDDKGAPLTQNADLAAGLEAAMLLARADGFPLKIGGYAPAPFGVRVAITTAGPDPAAVARDVQACLLHAFGSAGRGFDDAVRAETVETLVGRVPGVATVTLQALWPLGQPVSLVPTLEPAPPRLMADAPEPLPPQMLIIEPAAVAVLLA